MSAERALPWLQRFAWLSLFAFAAVLGLQNIRAFDYWWHLRTGRLIAETGSVPHVDPYTYSVEGAHWIDVHWLHQLGLHALYSLGGHTAVVVAKAFLVCGLVAILASIGYRRQRPLVSILALAWMLAVAADRFMPRPELPTFLCLAGVLALLERHERRPDAWVWAIVGIQLVWANLHGLFALGPVVCAIYAVAEAVRPLVAPGERLRTASLRRLLGLGALSLLACLANPNGLDGALYPIQQLGMIGPPEERGLFGSLIAELTPPLAVRDTARAPFVLWVGLGAASLAAMVLDWRRLPAAHPLLWVAFLYLALGAQRNTALFAIVAAPILAANTNAFLDARRPAVPGAPRLRSAAAGLVGLALLVAVVDVARDRFFLRMGTYRSTGLGTMEGFYPVGAAEWIARERPAGQICHHMADGGYLIWRLYPDYRVLVDGRLEVFGEDRFSELMLVGPERLRELDERFGCGSVLVHYSLVVSDKLLWWLYLNSNWRLVFVDDTAALFLRADLLGDDPPPELDPDDPELFPTRVGPPGVEDLMWRLARTNFYAALRRYEKALSLWEETLERYPDLEQGPIVHAFLLERNGFGAAAEAILRKLLRERPDDPILHVQVGDLRSAAGDLPAARELYDAALKLDPNLPYALYKRGLLAEQEGDADAAVLLYLRVVARSHPADELSSAARLRLRALQGGP